MNETQDFNIINISLQNETLVSVILITQAKTPCNATAKRLYLLPLIFNATQSVATANKKLQFVITICHVNYTLHKSPPRSECQAIVKIANGRSCTFIKIFIKTKLGVRTAPTATVTELIAVLQLLRLLNDERLTLNGS